MTLCLQSPASIQGCTSACAVMGYFFRGVNLWLIWVLLLSYQSVRSEGGITTLQHQNLFLKRPKPTPFTTSNRILTVLLSHNLNHFESVGVILHEYAAMCEAGWNPTVVLLTFANYTMKMQRLVEHKTYCSRIQSHFPVRFETNYNISSSRQYFAERLHEADVYIYQEDDMILRVTHINEWVRQMYYLNTISTADVMRDRTVGFLRYRRDNQLHPPYLSAKDTNVRDAQEEDLVKLEYIEEEPSVGYLCLPAINGTLEPYLFMGQNLHQAIWIFVRDQLEYLQTKCAFFNQTAPVGTSGTIEYMSDMSIWDKGPNKHNPQGGCGLTKMIPANIERFVIHHYYPGGRRKLHWNTIYNEIRRVYTGNRAYKGQIPDCWKGIVANARLEESKGV